MRRAVLLLSSWAALVAPAGAFVTAPGARAGGRVLSSPSPPLHALLGLDKLTKSEGGKGSKGGSGGGTSLGVSVGAND